MHLFAGAGGGILADVLLGHQPVCAVEINEYCQQVLSARQKDGFIPWFPIFDDVQTFDGIPWRGIVDIVAGGFPCQDISVAGKGAGIDGEHSGLWSEMARIIGEVRPRFAFVENSPALVNRGLGRVLGDLAALGYDCKWGVLGAADVGAPHQRDRIWILAVSNTDMQPGSAESWEQQQRPTQPARYRKPELEAGDDVANAESTGPSPERRHSGEHDRPAECCQAADIPNRHSHSIQRLEPESQPGGYGRQAGLYGGTAGIHQWTEDPADAPESRLGRVANGVANRVDRLKAIGNGQVPLCAATAWRMLTSL